MTKIFSILTSAATIAMAAVPLSAVPAFAHAEGGVKVELADLNLSQPADAARFQARVDRAAQQFCSTGGSLSQAAACHQAIRAEAVEKLGQAQRMDLRAALQDAAPASWRTASY